MKINDRVLFNHIINKELPIGSGQGIGTIKDFDGDFVIIETGIGEFYINKKEVKVLK